MDLRYGYANARIKAMEARLLTRKQMTDLYQVSSLPEMTVLLEETAYKEALVNASQKHGGVELLLVGFQRVWVQTLRDVQRVIPKKAQGALDVLLREWEVQDLKTILAQKALGQPVVPEELTLATEASRRLCNHLMEQKDWAGLVSVLKSSWCADAVRADEKRIVDQQDFRALSQALDRSFAHQVSQFVKSSPQANARALLRLRQEFLQTMIVLRLKGVAGRADVEKELFGPPSAKVQALLDASSLDDAIGLLALPDDVQSSYKARPSLSTIELALEKQFVESVLKKFRASVLNFGVVIGFLYLRSAELANLKRLALGKYFGVEEQFRPFLLAEVGRA